MMTPYWSHSNPLAVAHSEGWRDELRLSITSRPESINGNTACKGWLQHSLLWNFYIFLSITWEIHIFFKKCLRIRIVDHKVLILMCEQSRKQNEILTRYYCKCNWIWWDFHVFINLLCNYSFFRKIWKNEN